MTVMHHCMTGPSLVVIFNNFLLKFTSDFTIHFAAQGFYTTYEERGARINFLSKLASRTGCDDDKTHSGG